MSRDVGLPAVTVGPSRRRGRSTWVLAALAIYLMGAIVILLSPVSPEGLVTATTAWLRDDVGIAAVRQGWVEFGANVVLFAPLGILVALGFRSAWAGVAAAVMLSAGAELAQILLPGRMASARDVLANVLGAAVGSVLVVAVRAARRRREKRISIPGQAGSTLVRSPEGRPTHAIEPWSAP